MTDVFDRAQEREEEMRQDALQEQRIRSSYECSESARFCVRCETEIPEKRRLALPGVNTCVECQNDIERGAGKC